MSEMVILVIVGIVLFLVFVWMIVFFRKARDVTSGRNVEKARRKMKEPVSGTLSVTGISLPSSEAVWTTCEITGVLAAPGLDPRPVRRVGLARTALWPKPGDVLPILVDRARPDFYVIEWLRVKSGSDAAWNEAQRLAAEMKSGGA
jgi:hypothetical protein